MPRRIEVELTSERADGTWTWRAAGAKQPKGDLDGALLFGGAKVGDVVRADADFDVDGITIVSVVAPKEKPRREPERIEVIGTRRDQPAVTTTLVGKRGGDGRARGPKRGEGRPRGDERRERRGASDRTERSRGERAERRGERRPRDAGPSRPPIDDKPKPKRLRAGRAHRDAVLAGVPEEHKPIAEQVLRGGIPAVRQAVDKQNEVNRAAGKPEINAVPIIAIAEDILPQARTAEWHDRAEAALADVEELDLRDLRSVVVAADAAAKDDTTRALASQLREALNRRVETEHAAWLSEISDLLRDGRVVRALRLSSRPPKAGTPFPPELGTRLADATAAAMTADTSPDRFAHVVDALAYAPVRQTVKPQGVPEKSNDELRATVERLASRVPQIAAAFGIEAPAPRPRPPRPPRSRGPRQPEGARPALPPQGAEPSADGPGVSNGSEPAPAREVPANEG
jgi:hypothetical protein